jgi:hemerythrin
MDALNHSTSLNFMTEEAMFRAAGFKGADDHVVLHKAFMDRSRAMAKYRASEDEVLELLAFLKDW